jgi:hypothetical protein
MIIVELTGGIGNQMFQYAFAHILAHKNKTKLKLDVSFFKITNATPSHTPRNFELDVFSNQCNIASEEDINSFLKLSRYNQLKKKLGFNYPKIYREKQFHFDHEFIKINSSAYIKGYFQSYKYWNGHEDEIKKIFNISENTMDTVNKELLVQIRNTNAIAVHIRRGDYVTNSETQQFHGNCSFEYYINAINLIASKSKDFTLFFFSDDSQWVKTQFESISFPKVFVSHNKDNNSWKDIYLMKSCKHNIIANSSFSWWGSWLNNNSDKVVIAPKQWFAVQEPEINTNDLIPSAWIRM